jgi:hypothetical protein
VFVNRQRKPFRRWLKARGHASRDGSWQAYDAFPFSKIRAQTFDVSVRGKLVSTQSMLSEAATAAGAVGNTCLKSPVHQPARFLSPPELRQRRAPQPPWCRCRSGHVHMCHWSGRTLLKRDLLVAPRASYSCRHSHSLCRSIRQSDSTMEHSIAATSRAQCHSVGVPLQTNPLDRVRAHRRASEKARTRAVRYGPRPAIGKRWWRLFAGRLGV